MLTVAVQAHTWQAGDYEAGVDSGLVPRLSYGKSISEILLFN